MDNRVYYGEYSLKHWIELIMKGNIVLPEYQRYFVWNEKKVETLIETFKNKQFVPPVTIGAFRGTDTNENFILDGQQRLTSILLTYLGLFPDPLTFRRTIEQFANENDDNEESLDDVFEWTFKILTQKGKNKEDILREIIEGNYKRMNLNIDDHFLKNTFLGFSYLVPNTSDPKLQQKYYSSVFRNINIQGESLLVQESRKSLYFLDDSYSNFFNPSFSNIITIKNFGNVSKLDFVRYLSLLSQYKKDGNVNNIAKGYKSKMEVYYEEYIYSIVDESLSSMFAEFSSVFTNNEYAPRFERLREAINNLEIPKQFTSIIELDIYLFGLIDSIVFQNKIISTSDREIIKQEIESKIREFREDVNHSKAPSALKYLKLRIINSIDIYKRYAND